MVARLLGLCGLHLGESGDFSEPISSNPEGHWEHRRFRGINDQLLDYWGAGWDYPPNLTVDWHDQGLIPLRREAEHLIRELEPYEPWGWKDPRNSLTLPFWLDLLRRPKVVVAIRNPLEVAESLQKRNESSAAFCVNLWLAYHKALEAACPREQRIFVHYDAFFEKPEMELRRLVDFLDIPTPPSQIREATRSVKRRLRHHSVAPADLSSVGLQGEIAPTYDRLCREAGFMTNGGRAGQGPCLGATSATPAEALRAARRDPRPWWRRYIAGPVRRAVFRGAGVGWLVSHQENELRELRSQLAERISWARESEKASRPRREKR